MRIFVNSDNSAFQVAIARDVIHLDIQRHSTFYKYGFRWVKDCK